jgi:hypothetical protein
MTTRSGYRLLSATIVAAVLVATPCRATASDAPQVTVTLASGRKFTAAIDARSDDATLWLRFDSTGGMLLRPVAWSHVVSVRAPQGPMTVEELRKRWKELASRVELPQPAPASTDAAPNPVESAVTEIPPIRSLYADAYVAHWGPNVEADGILLVLSPVDEFGQLTPVGGMLDVELIADYRSYLRPAPLTTREPFNRIGSWTFRLTAADFVDGRSARLRLPFQAIDPQFTRNVDSFGLLTMKLAVPGQGVFATSVGDVRIRPMNNIRDRIEASTGARFLPGEQTGRPVRGGTWPY